MALAVTATIGSSLNCENLADGAHRVDAVHLGHHDVHQHDVDVGRGLQQVDRVAARFGRDGHHVVALQHAGQREDVADVVVDDQHLLAGQDWTMRSHSLRIERLAGLRQVRDRLAQHGGRVDRPAAPATSTKCRSNSLASASQSLTSIRRRCRGRRTATSGCHAAGRRLQLLGQRRRGSCRPARA